MTETKTGRSRGKARFRCPCANQNKVSTAAAVVGALVNAEGHNCDWIDSVEKKICDALGVEKADLQAFLAEDQRKRAEEREAKRVRRRARTPVAAEALPESLQPLWARFMATWNTASKTILAAEADEESTSEEITSDPSMWGPCLKQADSAQSWARGLIRGLPWADEAGLRHKIERATRTLEIFVERAGLDGT